MTIATERPKVLHLGVDLLLDRDGNAREKRRIPVELGQKLAQHLANANHVSAAGFHVHFLLVVEIRLEPGGKSERM